MKIGASTILHRDRPLDRDLFREFQEAGIESLELTDYHPDFDYDDLGAFADLRSAIVDERFRPADFEPLRLVNTVNNDKGARPH